MSLVISEILVTVSSSLLHGKVSVLELVNFEGKFHILASEKVILRL